MQDQPNVPMPYSYYEALLQPPTRKPHPPHDDESHDFRDMIERENLRIADERFVHRYD